MVAQLHPAFQHATSTGRWLRPLLLAARCDGLAMCAAILCTKQVDAAVLMLVLQGDIKSPLEYIQETEPIKVEGPVVASYGSEWQLTCSSEDVDQLQRLCQAAMPVSACHRSIQPSSI